MLTAKERDQAVFAMKDMSMTMYEDPRRVTYDDLDELQTILASRGLTIAPLNWEKAAPVPAPTSTKPAAPGQITATERAGIDVLWAGMQDMSSKTDYFVFKASQMRWVLTLLYRLLGVKK
jgi:hypothetical protein